MLENLFGSRARTNLLKLFLLNQEEFFVREIARETGEKLNSVRRELQNLEKLGLIQVVEKKVELNEAGTKKKIEKRKFYKVNQNFVLYDDLRSLFLKSKLLIERTLAQKLTELGKVKLLVLSGFFVDDKESFLARHKYMYDFELIKNVLEDVGFSGVTRCQYQQGRVPDIDFLDVYPDISLFVEAISSN